MLAALAALPLLASLSSGRYHLKGNISGEHLWSPYYRIDYDHSPERRIRVNLVNHQSMISTKQRSEFADAYALPYLLYRDIGQQPFKDVLIIGAGSGNDVSRALQWGAENVDAVEIDPVIQRLGQQDHPDRPFQDPRVRTHLEDGRNFLRRTNHNYDLIVYALVDSLVLQSSHSNIRLESYLFTREAFADVRRHLKPDGVFVIYNLFRQGWIVARIREQLMEIFPDKPLVLTFPYHETVKPEDCSQGFTVFLAGQTELLRHTFAQQPAYWFRDGQPADPQLSNGFKLRPEERARSQKVGPTIVADSAEPLVMATDDWPFLYLHHPMIPDLNLSGMIIMGAIATFLLLLFVPKPQNKGGCLRQEAQMFFLGAGFMLVETKAVVQMAVLFGSTWVVNSVVFAGVLVMILTANLFILTVQPIRLWPAYAGLLTALALNLFIPLTSFAGMNSILRMAGACLLVSAPIFFAGIVFGVSFIRSNEANRVFGANIAGAMFGGLAENSSMLLGYQLLTLLAILFYTLSALFSYGLSIRALNNKVPQGTPKGQLLER